CEYVVGFTEREWLHGVFMPEIHKIPHQWRADYLLDRTVHGELITTHCALIANIDLKSGLTLTWSFVYNFQSRLMRAGYVGGDFSVWRTQQICQSFGVHALD